MKAALVIAMAFGLSACGSTDFFGDSSAPATADASVQQAAPTPPALPEQTASAASPTAAEPATATQTGGTAPEQMPVQAAPTPVAQASVSPSVHCTALAKQRAIDAAFQGEDPDTQEAVYNRTYSDCVAWDLKHAFR